MSGKSNVARSLILSSVVTVLSLSGCSKDNPTNAVVDVAPPAAVADLAASAATSRSVTLTWTAPGDDGSSGTAAKYDVRYSLSPFTEVEWTSTTQALGEPKPRAAGNRDTFVVTTLSENTDYYFAMKTADEKSNWSPLSSVVSRKTPEDDVSPAAVTDLAAGNPAVHSITLTWTAPGDDEDVGAAAEYDIRWSFLPITDANWASAAKLAGEPAPGAAGTPETFEAGQLAANSIHHFALKSIDEKSNVSALSNVTSAATLSCTGCWWPLGAGAGSSPLSPRPSVAALGVYGTLLIAAGTFETAGGVSAMSIAAWNGTSWSPLGAGVTRVAALLRYGGRLIAGGEFGIAGGVLANNIAAWNGSSWSPLGDGLGGTVYALAVYDGLLIAGGQFTTAGGGSAEGIAAWNGSSWSPLGSGVNGNVYALVEYNGQLVAAGGFTTAGGVPANYIAAWNGSSWSPLGLGLEPIVDALAVYDGRLIAGGQFTTAGGVAASNVAAWDGGFWSPLESGMNVQVTALAVYNGRLIAGGYFTTAGDAPANYVAAWDGSAWSPMGSGMSGSGYSTGVSGLTVFDGNLIAGGSFNAAGGYPADAIAAWRD